MGKSSDWCIVFIRLLNWGKKYNTGCSVSAARLLCCGRKYRAVARDSRWHSYRFVFVCYQISFRQQLSAELWLGSIAVAWIVNSVLNNLDVWYTQKRALWLSVNYTQPRDVTTGYRAQPKYSTLNNPALYFESHGFESLSLRPTIQSDAYCGFSQSFLSSACGFLFVYYNYRESITAEHRVPIKYIIYMMALTFQWYWSKYAKHKHFYPFWLHRS